MSDVQSQNPYEPFAQKGTPFEVIKKQYEIQQQVNPELVLFNSLPEAEQSEVLQLALQIQHQQYESILTFGKSIQEKLSQFTNIMLMQTQKKDILHTGNLLNELLVFIDQIDPEALLPKELSFFGRLFSKKQPVIQEIITDYRRLKVRIDRLSIQLEHAQHQLLRDNEQLNELYQLNVDYFKKVNHYIAACELKLFDLKEKVLPETEAKMKSTQDPIDIQAYRDLRMQIEWLDKRKYDLEISREIAIQNAPQIRMLQQSGHMLIEKIQSSILTTIPVWQNQIAIILQINHQRKLAQAERKLIQASESLSKKNAAMVNATKKAASNQISVSQEEILRFKETQLKLLKNIEETLTVHEEAATRIQ